MPKKKGRPRKPTKETAARETRRQADLRKNSELSSQEAKRKAEADDFYGSLPFDNPLKAADGEPSHDFVYGSSTHAHSRS